MLEKLPIENIKKTVFLRAFGAVKIPLLFLVSPSVIKMTDQETILKIPLNYISKNHLGVMYFGALCMGGEAAVALAAADAIEKTGKRVDFLFRDFKANFIKRADGDVHFVCDEIGGVIDLVHKAIASKERENQTFTSRAFVPSKSKTEPVAEFQVTLTLKLRGG